jgi:YQGE family putative transporter
MLALAALYGLGQGYLVTAPALLVLMLVGKEGTLGAILAAGGIVSALLLYGLGRTTRPEHRVVVLGIGISLFLFGSLVNTALFNPAGVLVFMICIVLAKPTLEWSYFPIQMQVIDMVTPVENRSRYTYIFSHELGLYVGRFLGCSLFLYLAIHVSDVMALRIALPSIAAIQLLALPLAKRLLGSRDDMEAEARKAAITFQPVA